MTVNELKESVEAYRQSLKEKSKKMVTFSETGPVGMRVVDALVAAFEALEKRVAVLEKGAG